MITISWTAFGIIITVFIAVITWVVRLSVSLATTQIEARNLKENFERIDKDLKTHERLNEIAFEKFESKLDGQFARIYDKLEKINELINKKHAE